MLVQSRPTDHAKNIGKAYRSQAIELISICLIFSRVAPQFANEDTELTRVLRICDLALSSATDLGQKATDSVNKHFEKATWMLCRYFERWRRRLLSPGIPILPKGGSCTVRLSCGNCALPIGPSSTLLLRNTEDKWRPKMMIKCFSAKPSVSEVLWNFSRYLGRYTDRARITLEQNPHFYSNLPADESAYTHTFKHHPFGELSTALKPHDTNERWALIRKRSPTDADFAKLISNPKTDIQVATYIQETGRLTQEGRWKRSNAEEDRASRATNINNTLHH
ncbi:hypothetical protein EDB86DRAFT_2953394 [Lactarius hatsudake]|nr:hypothetical protein EDB86DRAFT_2953394 [Lactarius hatsudake]